jgi:predicted DNA-binding transcriptional regulator YafY
MRASRLVMIILLLQARGRLTAAQLAEELEISVRTVYRDVESLHAAGIPLYGDAGHRGGYQLLDGYRTRLTGLSADEAKALSLSGLPGPAAELGLGAVLAAAQFKVRAALPPALAEQLGASAERFHLDATGWYAQAEEAPYLPAVADAVWRGAVIRVRYRRWKAPTDVDRRLEPYGLVLKAGRWYLVAAPGPRTYRVDQMLDLTVLDEIVTIPDGFSLARYWQSYAAEFLAGLHRADAVVRLSPAAAARQTGPAAAALAATGTTEPDGWIRAVLPIESVDLATREFLTPDIEVLEPPELRARVAATARAIGALYRLSLFLITNWVLPAPNLLCSASQQCPISGSEWQAWRGPLTMARSVVLIVTIATFVAAIVMAAVQALGIAPRLEYAAVPGDCELLTADTVNTYLPDSMVSSQPGGTCVWTSVGGETTHQLTVAVAFFGSSDAVAQAQRYYGQPATNALRQTRQPVPGLGDQAAALTNAYQGTPAQTSLLVQSGNIDLSVIYSEAGQDSTSDDTSDDVMPADIAIARDILSVLARSANAMAVPAQPAGPDYVTPTGGCALVSGPTLARYLPGATEMTQPDPPPVSPPGSRSRDCEWVTPNLTSLTLAVNISAGPAAALQDYAEGIAADARNADHVTLSVSGLGNRATMLTGVKTAIDGWSADTDLLVWSGDAEVELDFGTMLSPPPGVPAPPAGTDQLTALEAAAHDVLTALALPGTNAGPAPAPWPSYRLPPHACSLVRTTTLIRYVPYWTTDGAHDAPANQGPGMQEASCRWTTQTHSSLSVQISTSSGASAVARAQQEFESDLLADRGTAGERITGTRQLPGPGALATVILQAGSGSKSVILLAWSGNAVIQVNYGVSATVESASHTDLVAAASAAVQDILASLRSG